MRYDKQFKNIMVSLGQGMEMKFDFQINEDQQHEYFARISTEKYDLMLDQELTYISGNIPIEWIDPIIDKLVLLLKANEHQDGTLN